jgi:hypothetical protein
MIWNSVLTHLRERVSNVARRDIWEGIAREGLAQMIQRTRTINWITVRNDSMGSALIVRSKNICKKTVGRKKKMQTKDQKDGNHKCKANMQVQP